MRKIAREVEFNSKVEKKRRGLIPLRDMNLDDYKAYKEAKLAQMKLLDYSSSFPVDENVPEPQLNPGEKFEAEAELDGGERVAPKNPSWAVYGRGLEDVTEFFNSDNYDPTAKTPGGRPKLFNKEEKVLLNKRIPDLAAATSYGWTPLHFAVQAQRTDLVRLLLIKGADKTLKNEDGLTPLDLCLYNSHSARTYELIKLFTQPQRRLRHVSV